MSKEKQDPKAKFDMVIKKVAEEMVKTLDSKDIDESLSTIVGVTSSQHILEEVIKNLEPSFKKKLKEKKENLISIDRTNIFEN